MRQSGDLKLTPLRFILAVTLLITASLFLLGCYSASSRQRVGVSVEYASDDYAVLAAYGEWVDYGPYGTVWRPYVGSSWQPFYYGHWVWTGYEWAWVSYEPYGWLVYHYGYWDYQPGFGWFWIAGQQWSPARVEWTVYGDYVAWTPLPPPGVTRPRLWESSRVSVSIGVNVWNVVTVQNFTKENVGHYKVKTKFKPGQQIDRQVSSRAPDLKFVETYSRHSVPEVKIEKQQVTVQNQRYDKIVLPAQEVKKVDKHQSRVEREVLKPQKGNSGKIKGEDNEKKKGETRSKGKKPDR